jgi:predicted permease
MMSLAELGRRLLLLFRRDRATREMEEEMRLHVALRAESLSHRGAAPDEAALDASRRFGDRLRRVEEVREHWGFARADAVIQDARYAARRLMRQPAFTISVVAVLALGIGATTAMFSAVDAAMLRPLPFQRPSELVTLRNIDVPFDPGAARRRGEAAPAGMPVPFDYLAVRALRETFVSIASYASGGLNISDEERPMRANAGVVTASFFETLGVFPAQGRPFTDDDARDGAPKVVLISHGLWQRFFGGTDVVGKHLPLNGRLHEIIGVMPPGFAFPARSDLWIPMSIPTTSATFEAFRGFLPDVVLARLAPNVTIRDAERQMIAQWEAYVARLPKRPGVKLSAEMSFEAVRGKGALTPLRDELVGVRRQALLVLFGATVLLLLIACANVTSLLLAYGTARRRELAVRSVLGATRVRVIRQLMVESVMLSLAAAGAGVALAPLLLRSLSALMPSELSGVAGAQVDLRVLTFAAVIGTVTGIVFGVWPALGVSRASASERIKTGGGWTGSAAGPRRVQRWLVGAELALTVMLLVGAGLMLRSFERLTNTDTGMRVDNVATLEMGFGRGVDLASRLRIVDAISDRLRTIPGMQAVGVVNDLPLRGSGGISVWIDVPGAKDGGGFVRYLVASEGYFDAMGIPLRRGRLFSVADDDRGPSVAVISDSMAKLYWPDADPVGRTFRFGGDTNATTVIGVVSDVRESGLERSPGPQMYFPSRMQLGANLAIVARSSLEAHALLGHLQSAVRAAEKSQAVYNVRMMREVVGASVAPRRANTFLITLFGAIALAVSTLGVYAVTAYAVSQRSREFGIRAALGAVSADLARKVGGELLWLSLAGLGAGIALAWALSRVMANLVYGVSVRDVTTFAFAPAILLIAVVVAAAGPVRRAARTNPMDVIRED